ncbi:MAG: ATP-binding protein, partial [candidate division KSB1 bacterium]
NSKDEVYLRIGDQSRKLTFDERMQLAYDRGEASWESALLPDFSFDDLDKTLLERYRRLCGTALSAERLLLARNLAEQKNDRVVLNRAGVLLFSKNPYRWFPRADLRFLRYEGTVAETGPRMNLIKDIRIDLPLPKLLDEAFRVVGGQLRDYTKLGNRGKFETTPEYPKFAWQEALANAVIHRAYNIYGTDIQVKMFDDRLEVESPGKLPGLVRLDNMRHIHFSRNPLLARVMTEMKYMRDFGEGVDRMYREMEARGMQTPTYEEYAFMLRVTLRNNSEQRQSRQVTNLSHDVRAADLNERQQRAFQFLQNHGRITLRDYLSLNPETPERTARYDLKVLTDLKIITPIGGRKGRSYVWIDP